MLRLYGIDFQMKCVFGLTIVYNKGTLWKSVKEDVMDQKVYCRTVLYFSH